MQTSTLLLGFIFLLPLALGQNCTSSSLDLESQRIDAANLWVSILQWQNSSFTIHDLSRDNNTQTLLTPDITLIVTQFGQFVGVTEVVDFVQALDPVLTKDLLQFVQLQAQIDNSSLSFSGDQLTFDVTAEFHYDTFNFTSSNETEHFSITFEPCSSRISSTAFSFPHSFDLYAASFSVDPVVFCSLAFTACNITSPSASNATANTNFTESSNSTANQTISSLLPFGSFGECISFVNATEARCPESPFKGNSSLCRTISVLSSFADPENQCPNIGANSNVCSNINISCPSGFNVTNGSNPFLPAQQGNTTAPIPTVCSDQECCTNLQEPNPVTGDGFLQFTPRCANGGLHCVDNTSCELCHLAGVGININQRPLCSNATIPETSANNNTSTESTAPSSATNSTETSIFSTSANDTATSG